MPQLKEEISFQKLKVENSHFIQFPFRQMAVLSFSLAENYKFVPTCGVKFFG